MSDNELLDLYKKLVPFISQVIGNGCEVVLHDTTNIVHSVIAICNPISGRSIGDPLTDLAKQILQKSSLSQEDYLANYSGKSKGRDFLSSTYVIKNEGRIIGMLCINKDISLLHEFQSSVNTIFEKYNLVCPDDTLFTENLDNSAYTYVQRSISRAIKNSGILPSRMTPSEKKEIIKKLKADGILELKGSIAECARQLYISVPTVYRYSKSANETSQVKGTNS